jgi:hypothetical protein
MKGKLWFLILALAIGGATRAQTPGSIAWKGTPHGIALSCTASTSAVAGYNFYRGTVSGGPYVKINSTLQTSCAFEDSYTGLTTSSTYFYVATAVDSSGDESAYSNQASVLTPATFPSNPPSPTNLGGTPQ